MKPRNQFGEVLHLRIPRDLLHQIDAQAAILTRTDRDGRRVTRPVLIRRAIREFVDHLHDRRGKVGGA
jgi:hypothetical protein